MGREQVRGQLDLLLLAVLRGGPAHGYAIITSLHQRSRGAFNLAEGTVYPALHRLESDGVVASSWAEVDGRRRRVYCLTRSGEGALATRDREWRGFARGVNAVLGVTP